MLAGALWGLVPGVLKAWRGVHEVITTIMLNYVAFSHLAVARQPGRPARVGDAAVSHRAGGGDAALPESGSRHDCTPASSWPLLVVGLMLVVPLPDPDRLSSSGWSAPTRRRAVQRHRPGTGDRPGDGAVRRAGRPGRHRRGARRARPLLRLVLARLRLRLDRRRAARRAAPRRRGRRRVVLRRACEPGRSVCRASPGSAAT